MYESGQEPRKFLDGIKTAYLSGKIGSRAALENSAAAAYLTDRQKKQAYMMGWQEPSTIGNIENEEVRGIIGIRTFAMSLRKSPYHILSAVEIKSVERDAREIGVDLTILRFNLGGRTGFVDEIEMINIRGDILPDPSGTSARDRMSQRAVLAHEYYGHYMNHPSPYPEGDWRDEFRASYNIRRGYAYLRRKIAKDDASGAGERTGSTPLQVHGQGEQMERSNR